MDGVSRKSASVSPQTLVATRDVYYWSVGGILRIDAGATVYVVKVDELRQVVEIMLDNGLTYRMRMEAVKRCFEVPKNDVALQA